MALLSGSGGRKVLGGFSPGRLVTARVVNRQEDGEATLSIGGRKISAQVSQPVAEGRTVRMRVTHVDSSRISLKQLTFADHPVGRYLMALRGLGRKGPFQYLTTLFGSAFSKGSSTAQQLKEKLQHLITQLAVKPGESTAQDLREMVRGSGLMHERQVLDEEPRENIKSLSLKLGRASEEDEPLSKTVKAFIDGIEKLQVVNRATGEISGRFLLPLPIFMDGRLTFGQLLIDRGEERSASEGGAQRMIRLAMHLKLSRMGEMRVDLSLYKGAVAGMLSVASKEACDLLLKEMAGLGAALGEKGFLLRHMGVQEVEPAELASGSLVDDLVEGMDRHHVEV